MDYFKTLVAIAVVAFATLHVNQASAAPAGDEIFKATYIRANIVKGKTTSDQVLAKFGEPTSQTMDDSSETWVYQRNAAQAQQKKRGGGLGGFMGLVKGVAATAYELAPETGGAASRLYSGADRVERTANSATALSGAGAEQSSTGGAGPSALQIQFRNGVVSSFSLR